MAENMFVQSEEKNKKSLANSVLNAGRSKPSEMTEDNNDIESSNLFENFEVEVPEEESTIMVHLSLDADIAEEIKKDKKKYGTKSYLANKVLRHYYESKGRIPPK